MKPMARAQQQGAVTLIMVLVLVLLAPLASGYSSRGILLGQASSQSLGRAQEARLAAQAALASSLSSVVMATRWATPCVACCCPPWSAIQQPK